jgi:uncharacterized membrane protein
MTGFTGPGYVGENRPRLGYLDWARGLAVLLMIHMHAFYSWVRPEDRDTRLFALTRLIGGYPAALFLLLAGVAAALVAEREREKGERSGAVLWRGIRRGLTVLGYALLFRVAMLASGFFGRPADLLRVDILNCVAVALMLVAIALAAGTARGRAIASFGLAAAIALATPLAWDGSWWKGWPIPLAGYITGRVPDAVFPVFPWAAFAALGAACGVLLAHARSRGREGIAVALMAAGGAAAIPAGLLLDRYGPTVYPKYDFWYTSPAYLVLKAGVVLVVVGAAYLLDRIPGPSALRQFGRTSLLIYWLHLEVAYGQWVAPSARGRLPIEDAVWGVATLILAMFAVSIARTSVGGSRLRRRELVKA